MGAFVQEQGIFDREGLLALIARERTIDGVHALMDGEGVAGGEVGTAFRAIERPIARVQLHVTIEVAIAGERLLALLTLERLFAIVCAAVP